MITVDFVNEPGLLGDHHLVTRLTNNNGVFSFAASVNLDFNATDQTGNPLFDGADVSLKIDQLQQRGSQQDSEQPRCEHQDHRLLHASRRGWRRERRCTACCRRKAPSRSS